MVRCGTGRYRFKNKFKNRAKVNGAHPAKAGWALESQSQSQSQLRPPEGGRYKFKNKFKSNFKNDLKNNFNNARPKKAGARYKVRFNVNFRVKVRGRCAVSRLIGVVR